jgi:hypothetical protein
MSAADQKEHQHMSPELRLLSSIDERLGRIEDKLTRAEMTFAGFLAGPGKKLLRLFGNGNGGELCGRRRSCCWRSGSWS